MKTALAVVCLLAIMAPSHAVDVYKWTDSQGGVHYSDAAPAASAASSSSVNVADDDLSANELRSARERLARERRKLAEPISNPDGVDATSRREPVAHADSCADSWAQYDASAMCFRRNRLTDNGKGVSPAGEAFCKQLPQPGCAR